jgi:putative cardiolipin synthase
MTRFKRMLAWCLVALAVLVASGLLLGGYLTPAATGAPGRALPVQPAATALDREIAPLVARNGGKTGAILVPDGLDAFAARALSARQAERSLDLQYYIWHDDLTGRLLGREAWLAAERGVRVRMLLDDINAGGKDLALLTLDAHPKIEVRLYNPLRNRNGIGRAMEMLQRFFRLNHRMHNKAWIADGRMAVLGGRNIGIEYFNASDESNFHDLDLVLFGPAVQQASDIFDRYWNSAAAVPVASVGDGRSGDLQSDATQDEPAQALIARARAEAESPAARAYLQRVEASPNVRAYLAQTLRPFWSDRIAIVSDPPIKHDLDRTQLLVDRIERDLRGARRKAFLISPYFVPGDDATTGLVTLAKHGVHTGVVTNSLAANDVAAVHGGYSKYRPRLLAGGVHLYEIRAHHGDPAHRLGSSSGASLHTKAYVIDDARGFIGSFNMDPRSANLNTEMGVFFDDPGIAAALRDEYLHLAGPAMSYWLHRNDDGALRWLDRSTRPPTLLDHEPEATGMARAQAALFRWLPVESQL